MVQTPKGTVTNPSTNRARRSLTFADVTNAVVSTLPNQSFDLSEVGWQTSIFNWQTFPDLRLIYG